MNPNHKEIQGEEKELMAKLDNLDMKISHNGQQYLVLLKKQQGKVYSTLYLTDCMKTFWLRKLDIEYLSELRQQLKLKTSMSTFIDCFLASLRKNSILNIENKQEPKNEDHDQDHNDATLSYKLQIGQGLTMQATLEFNAKVDSSIDEKGFQIILKMFLLQLYQSRQSQQDSLQNKILFLEKQSQEEVPKGRKDQTYFNGVLELNDPKKQIHKDLKHRDITNPNKRKRKNVGVKLLAPS